MPDVKAQSVAMSPVPLATDGEAAVPETRTARPCVAVVCDLPEEGWHSMDLVADMLLSGLTASHADEVSAFRVCARMKTRAARMPFFGGSGAAHNADRLLNRFFDYPRNLRRRAAEFDLFHIVDHSYSQLVHELPAKRTVVTCHDLDTFRCLVDPQREQRPRWFRAMARRILDGFQQAAHVIVVSETIRSQILAYGLVPAERLRVIYNGVHPACSPLPDAQSDTEALRMAGAGPGTLQLLSVGSTAPRKRLDVLLRVFAAIRRQNPRARLVRVGGFTPEQLQMLEDLGLSGHVAILPFLERNMLSAVYRNATLLLHTAEAEGFGLPIVEAMACGCPVVASDLPVLREVGGSVATFCPVGEVEAWAVRVEKLLQEQQDQRAWEARRQAAVMHAAKFSWADNAAETNRLYREILAAL